MMIYHSKNRSKYGAKKVEYQGITFDSKAEFQRYLFLSQMEKDGVISDLRRQVRFELLPTWTIAEEKQLKTKVKLITRVFRRACYYVADFVYIKDGKEIVEDVKGLPTPVYKLKEHMMHSLLGIDIRIVKKPTEKV